MKRVAIIQSNYIPWRGYFDIMDDADLFIIHDDLQYTKQDWRNRNRIVTPQGLKWLTVPVHYLQTKQLIQDTAVDQSTAWQDKHLNLIDESYRRAPYFSDFFSEFSQLLRANYSSLSELNIALLIWASGKLGIQTEIVRSSMIPSRGTKSAKLMDLLSHSNADVYISGPSGASYLDVSMFAERDISLAYKQYDYEPYPQMASPFEGAVSILDLLFNTGPNARAHLKSKAPLRIAFEAGK